MFGATVFTVAVFIKLVSLKKIPTREFTLKILKNKKSGFQRSKQSRSQKSFTETEPIPTERLSTPDPPLLLSNAGV